MKYYKATDHTVTVFRATAKRQYQSVCISWGLADRPLRIKFSGSTVQGMGSPVGYHPVVEIDRDEYQRLAAIRDARLFAGGAKDWTPSPQDAWVCNVELA